MRSFSENAAGHAVSASFLLLGAAVTVWGISASSVSDVYGIPPETAGSLLTIMATGRMASVFISGVFCDRAGYKVSMSLGVLFLIVPFVLISFHVPLSVLRAAMFVSGAGHGMLDTSGVYTIRVVYPKTYSSHMSNIQLFYGLGALCIPIVVYFAQRAAGSWKLPFILLALFSPVIFLFLFFGSGRSSDIPGGNVFRFDDVLKTIPRTLLSLPAFIIFLYSGIGLVLTAWLPAYFESAFAESRFTALSLTSYNAGLTAGAFLCRRLTRTRGAAAVTSGAAAGAGIVWFLLLAAPSPLTKTAAVMFFGMMLGGLYSMCISLSIRGREHLSGTVTGILATFAGVGAMSLTAVSNSMLKFLSVDRFFILFSVITTLLAFCGMTLWFRGKRGGEQYECL